MKIPGLGIGQVSTCEGTSLLEHARLKRSADETEYLIDDEIDVQSSGVNLINTLHAAFTLADPKSAQNTVKSFFALMGYDA